MCDNLPTCADVEAAAARIASLAHRTPVLRSRTLDAMVGAELHFKCENLQRVGIILSGGNANLDAPLPWVDDLRSV